MSVAAYAEYKDSGAIWLGAVPMHWKVAPLKYLTTLRSGGTPSKNREDYWLGDIPWASAKDLKSEKISDTIDHIGTVAIDEGAASISPAGCILVLVRGMMLARAFPVVQTEVSMAFNQDLKALTPIDGIAPAFLAWALKATAQESMDRCEEAGHGTKALRMDAWLSMSLPRPTPSEQAAIASFLDRETGKIDALVEEQRRLIALLKEKRQAVISHAVTKGLDPNAPMKDAGVEWLGSVPAHWIVKSIKWLSPVLRGASPRPIDDPKYFDDEGEYAWVRIADSTASDGRLMATTQRLSHLGSTLSVRLEPGQLFVSIAGTVGKPCITEIKACIHDGFVYFPQLSTDPKFLYRIFEAGLCYGGLGKMGTQLNLNTDTIGSIRVAVPPVDELQQILSFLDRETGKIDALVERAERGSALLSERRAALISAAVTGKIDVRCLAQPEAVAE